MAVSFATNIRPMFTDTDIAHMKNFGVLLDDFGFMRDPSNAQKVLNAVSSGAMPPSNSGETSWSPDQVEGRDPKTTTAGDLAQGKPVWVDADADDSEVLRLMEEHQIRRLPVIEEYRLVGMISEADLATHLLPADRNCGTAPGV